MTNLNQGMDGEGTGYLKTGKKNSFGGGEPKPSPSIELLQDTYNCTVKRYSASQMMIDFLYASNAADIARLLVEAEVPFSYETEEIFLTENDLEKLLKEVYDLWGDG